MGIGIGWSVGWSGDRHNLTRHAPPLGRDLNPGAVDNAILRELEESPDDLSITPQR